MATGLLEELMNALRCLPGVGAKSAQRMAFHLLERDRQGAERLSVKIAEALEKIGHCRSCRNFSESEICQICANPKRDSHVLCIVESPADMLAVEQAANYRGLYFVLMGRLSPLDGIGPGDIGLDVLERRFRDGDIEEVILATNPTVEGEATAHFISGLARKYQKTVTRIAHGVPMGGELEYVDSGTLSRAFEGRLKLD
ncbi:MAG: recombination mediator RecR [Gammaproteobacteria bacterium]|nr:recombination mediator RecR [Gammaproteobacteria bacterium]